MSDLAPTFHRLGGRPDADRWVMPDGQRYAAQPDGTFLNLRDQSQGQGEVALVRNYLAMTTVQAQAWLANPRNGESLTAPAPRRPRPR